MIGGDKISEIVNKIVSGYSPDKIILFGSYASGKPNENSDLDLFVIKNTNLPRPQRTTHVRKMLYGLGKFVFLITNKSRSLFSFGFICN